MLRRDGGCTDVYAERRTEEGKETAERCGTRWVWAEQSVRMGARRSARMDGPPTLTGKRAGVQALEMSRSRRGNMCSKHRPTIYLSCGGRPRKSERAAWSVCVAESEEVDMEQARKGREEDALPALFTAFVDRDPFPFLTISLSHLTLFFDGAARMVLGLGSWVLVHVHVHLVSYESAKSAKRWQRAVCHPFEFEDAARSFPAQHKIPDTRYR